jgi:hypothetical protein
MVFYFNGAGIKKTFPFLRGRHIPFNRKLRAGIGIEKISLVGRHH